MTLDYLLKLVLTAWLAAKMENDISADENTIYLKEICLKGFI